MVPHSPQPRRPRLLWWLPALVLLLGLGWAFNSLVTTSRADTIEVEELRSQTITLDRAARSFVRLVEQVDALDRSELDSIITQSRDSLAVVDSALSRETGSADPLVTLLGVSLDLWDRGLEGFEAAFLSAVDNPFNYVVEEQLIAALVNLRSGDHLYQAFLEEANSDPDTSPLADFRSVVFLPGQYPVVDTAQFLTTYARLYRPSLEFNTDFAIEQVASHPEWISDLEGLPVITPTDSFDLLVVVANRGNVEAPGEVFLELSIWPPGEAIQTRLLEVPPLRPGEKTTITFYELAVTPDTSYQVEVRLSYIDGDQSLGDNNYGFTMRVGA